MKSGMRSRRRLWIAIGVVVLAVSYDPIDALRYE
jgi:hypothetical protein